MRRSPIRDTPPDKLEYLDFPLKQPVGPKDAPPKERPAKNYYVWEMAVKGKNVAIHTLTEYPIFFRLFTRYCKEKSIKRKLYIRQLSADTWIMFSRKENDVPPPKYITDEMNFRTCGRFKFYADRLQKGERLRLSEPDAKAARRAWNNYHGRKRNPGRHCVIKKGNVSKSVLLSVEDCAG
jgi:hypothetical protein